MRTKLSTIGSSISFPSRSCFFRSFFFICWHSQGASLLVGVEMLGGRAMAAAKGERFPVPSVTSHFRPTVLVSFRSSPIPCRHSYRESLDRNHRTLREYYQLNAFCLAPVLTEISAVPGEWIKNRIRSVYTGNQRWFTFVSWRLLPCIDIAWWVFTLDKWKKKLKRNSRFVSQLSIYEEWSGNCSGCIYEIC